jgi:hypothetical protein
VDDDCDDVVDEGLTYDDDFDGYTSPASCKGTRDDCDDTDSSIHPGATEICENGLDDDCDGVDAACETPTTTLPPQPEYDSIIETKTAGLKLAPADGRLTLAVSGLTMVRPDGVFVCCGPDNGNQWVCGVGLCG